MSREARAAFEFLREEAKGDPEKTRELELAGELVSLMRGLAGSTLAAIRRIVAKEDEQATHELATMYLAVGQRSHQFMAANGVI